MNTSDSGNNGNSNSSKELDEARQLAAKLTAERDDARRQAAQSVHELNMARNREDALHGRIRQLEEMVKSLQGGAILAGIVGFGAALFMRKR